MSDANQLIKEARKIILANSFARTPNKGWLQRAADHLKKSTAKPVAAPDDATDWEGIAADQAMTIAMLRVDYQQLQALVTSQGIALMEQEEWQKEAARYRFMRVNQSFKFWTEMAKLQPVEWDAYIDAAMGESHDHQTNR